MTKKKNSKKKAAAAAPQVHKYCATFSQDDFLFLRAIAISESTPEKAVSVQQVLNELIEAERKRNKKVTVERVTEKE